MRQSVHWILWNLFLAVVPVVLGAAAAAVGHAMRRRRDGRLWLLLAPLLFLWLIFLPNSCYLFTELRHFMEAISGQDLWFRAHGDRWAMVRLALHAAVGFVYVTAGALTFGLAIRPVRSLAEDAGIPTRLWSPLFFILMALGVYLGLVVRFNSWDLFTRGGEVFRTAFAVAADRPRLTLAIILFGFFLWATYEVIDIWIDGSIGRWPRRPYRGRRDDEPTTAGNR
jgi:uncharacterized membrane protein